MMMIIIAVSAGALLGATWMALYACVSVRNILRDYRDHDSALARLEASLDAYEASPTAIEARGPTEAA